MPRQSAERGGQYRDDIALHESIPMNLIALNLLLSLPLCCQLAFAGADGSSADARTLNG
jgi:hypothetical protein